MKLSAKVKAGLDKKFQKVSQTPASPDFFTAIHDYIEYIEGNEALATSLSQRVKINRELNIPTKYDYLKKIYQGLEDINSKSDADLGHARYAVIIELNRIRNKEASESNSIWKKRELFRKLAGEVHERLSVYLSEPA